MGKEGGCPHLVLDFGIGPAPIFSNALTISGSLLIGMPTSISSGLMSVDFLQPKHPNEMLMFP